MLVLSRKMHEEIMIGDDIVLTILDVGYGKVRLGIQAPKELPVHRREVYERIHAESAGPDAKVGGEG